MAPSAFITFTALPCRTSTTRFTVSPCREKHHPMRLPQSPHASYVATTNAGKGTPQVGTGLELKRPPAESVTATGPLSAAQIDHFFTEGFVIIRGLLSTAEIEAMRASIPDIEVAARSLPLYEKMGFLTLSQSDSYRAVATNSAVTRAVRQLTPTLGGSRDLVVLRDAYMRLSGENKGCGFHVDDSFFWPCPRDAPGPGVNVWMPLDPVTPHGGGLTFVPRSHTPDFLDCRESILTNTCSMETLYNDGHKKLEALAISPTFEPGDVLICSRFVFHRGNPFYKDAPPELKARGIARYSVRYMPSEAIVWDTEIVDGQVVRGEPAPLKSSNQAKYPTVAA